MKVRKPHLPISLNYYFRKTSRCARFSIGLPAKPALRTFARSVSVSRDTETVSAAVPEEQAEEPVVRSQ